LINCNLDLVEKLYMSKITKALFLAIALGLFVNITIADIANTDINKDYRVNWKDLNLFANQWLDDPCDEPQSADLNYDGDVNFQDFASLAANWEKNDIPLVINEFMADNNDILADNYGEFDDWIEIYNPGQRSVNTKGMFLTDDSDLAEPNLWPMPELIIAPNQYVLIWADNQPTQGNLHATFKLSASSDDVILVDIDSISVIDSVDFDSQKENYSFGRIPNGQGPWRVLGSPSPLAENIPFSPGDIVVNEIMAHSDIIHPYDWIELKNTSDYDIDISGWFLSDSDQDDANLMKYEIAQGTILPHGDNGFIVFYQNLHFGNPAETGCNKPFGLSENGEMVCLSPGQNGSLMGYTLTEVFGASDKDVSFGRYQKSTGSHNFTAMAEATPNEENSYPKVGPIVINEIMYNPASDVDNEEYIELYNITSSAVTLYDYHESLPWRFTSGIGYIFPANTTIAAYSRLIIAKDPATFTTKYGPLPTGVGLLGPYDAKLSNSGEKIELSKPGDIDEDFIRHYILVDKVSYDDDDPWPENADGDGASLSRKVASDYGNDPANWLGTIPPTPGN